MIHKIKSLILSLSLLFSFSLSAAVAVPLLASAPVYAAGQQDSINGNLCSGSNIDITGGATTNDQTKCAADQSTLSTKIKTILNVLSAVIALVAVVMIVYAGFRYVSSAGGEAGVKAAKNAIVYAIIGLVVVALAQVIVHFVISNVAS